MGFQLIIDKTLSIWLNMEDDRKYRPIQCKQNPTLENDFDSMIFFNVL
jgi:hypothetical protein